MRGEDAPVKIGACDQKVQQVDEKKKRRRPSMAAEIHFLPTPHFSLTPDARLQHHAAHHNLVQDVVHLHKEQGWAKGQRKF